jgi:hypothetical protein
MYLLLWWWLMLKSVADELRNCNFGDKRLTKRAMSLGDSVSQNPEYSINAACGSFSASKAAYRFFQNKKVNPTSILSGHLQETLIRSAAIASKILVIQDTTDLIYTKYPSIQGLGHRLKSNASFSDSVKGILLHSSLAVTFEGVPLGILKQTFFTYDEMREKRQQDSVNIRGINKKLPIDKKASFRWVDHFIETNKSLKSIESEIIHVADREGDVYEFLQAVNDEKSHLVIRSNANRRTHEGPAFHDASTIEKKLKDSPILGKTEVSVDGKPVSCIVKSVTTLLKPPARSGEAKCMILQPLSIGVVEVKEEGNSSDPIHWRLLTTLSIKNFDEVVNVISIYKQRWSIECFHRILKSGFGVEEARLGTRQRLENLASLLSVVSWHIFWLFQFGRKIPDLAAKEIFDPLAIQVLQTSAKKLKITPGSNLNIGEALLIVARLGGFLGRKGDGLPGMISIWRGWRCLHERIEFMEALTCG